MSEWIEWKGGEQPMEDSMNVKIRWRSGFEPGSGPAYVWSWSHQNGPYDIIAYRIIKEGEE